MAEGFGRRRFPPWTGQVGRALLALGLGILVGLSAQRPEVLLAVSALILAMFVTASMTRPDPLVFVAFVLLTMPKLRVPGSPLPMSEVMMLFATFSAFLTLKEGLHTMPRWARLALGAFMGVFVASTLLNGLFEYGAFKRTLHVSVWALTIVGLVRGLLPWRPALRGLQTGLVISALYGIVMLPKSRYAGRLTGLFQDPNVAGLLLVVGGTVALSGIARPRNRVLFLAVILPALALTYSRTALLAAIMAGLWMLVGRKLKPLPAMGVVLLVAMIIAVLPTSLQSIGPFSDRSGSDQLRNRVAAQEWSVVSEKPILGHGAGTATIMVNFGRDLFYFHDSYLALVQETGLIGLALMMTLLLGTFLALMSLDTTDRRPLLEAAIIGVWVMSINLGEVLLELSTAVAIGFALAYVAQVRARTQGEERRLVPLRPVA